MHVYTVIKTPKEESVIHEEYRHQKNQRQRKNDVDPVKTPKRKDRSEIHSKYDKHVYISAVDTHVYSVMKTPEKSESKKIGWKDLVKNSKRERFSEDTKKGNMAVKYTAKAAYITAVNNQREREQKPDQQSHGRETGA